MSAGLPAPTSGPSVAAYFVLGLLIALVMVGVILTVLTILSGHVDGLRVAMGLRRP